MRHSLLPLILFAALPALPAAAQDQNTYSTVERGLYLTRMGDCEACHTVEGEGRMAGGFGLPTPFGTIYSANLTPDEATGIGSWSADAFYRAMNEGIGHDGKRLYPAFPYTNFTIVTREDSDAIFSYLQTIEPVRNRVPEPDIPFPLDIRTAMRGWNLLFFDERDFDPDPQKSELWNRGKYVVEGLAHCSACHSPRNPLGAQRGGDASYTGGHAEGWYAPSLRDGDAHEGIGEWSEEDLATYLKTGRNGRTAAIGPMAEVVEKSTQYLDDEDIAAIAAYIKDLPFEDGEPEEVEPVRETDPAMIAGAEIYATQCAACHGMEGEGVENIFGGIAGSSLTQADDPTTVVHIILRGARAAVTDAYPTPHAMPAFDWKLTDEEVAQVTTFVRNAFGNAAPAITSNRVGEIREAE
ncbi:cytochrome c [Palleronia sp. LCG004]|uniref:c-type cytochrome n=1 Tax=Palleronia sp. LCG004 TaxID=3079304 RepID=UPI002943DCA9|nr:cytochrome c [Palleronia sp. LCG004]WOI56620.1 cytochrome c [Palleronia sp. LCG004]